MANTEQHDTETITIMTKEGVGEEEAQGELAVQSSQQQAKKESSKKGRPICPRCHRPTPRACICEGLPSSLILLNKCHVLVLQHPHEKRRKNCSLPLLQLCLHSSSMTVIVARRFGDQCPPTAMALLQQQAKKVLLIFPEDDTDQDDDSNNTLTLTQAREFCRQTTTATNASSSKDNGSNESDKILIVVLDATWKYAREMDRANQPYYPSHMKRVALSWDDPLRPTTVPFRFDIRTPPSQVHLSTAECIAWVLSALEDESSKDNQSHNMLYSNLMKPLDCMVQKWHECRRTATDNHGTRRNNKRQKQQQDRVDSTTNDNNHTATNNYYTNPDHDTTKLSEKGVSRTSFFTMGDDGANNKHKKSNNKRRRNK
ncbi:DTW domain-containing protein 2 [Seminavis robusta]|uniref:tRNA-uridine aminocarboxypropyltransferase n=1 Tax=Seminavis robusta TaxID=568900 RepID=A0A9N8HQW6_9STRA|nr:DTW domain-containing protein 2 [Seminavis robusta]|eukprot:Sro1022_g232400.1 DTW domain-containing protein 2 (371) ;mRNA; r:22974-24086